MTPIFCDVDPITLNLDPEAAATAIGERTVGLLPVDILGYPAALPQFERLAADRGLGLLEDACEALGARDSEGRSVGTRGWLATFAFYANKQLTTGEGGMLAVGDPELAARLRSERNQGRAPNMDWVDHDRLGFNYRLSELQAALGVAQLEQLERRSPSASVPPRPVAERLAALDYGAPAGEGDPAGLVLPMPRPRRRSGAAGSSMPCACPPAPTATPCSPTLPSAGSRPRPTCRAIHLMGFYRERFGFRQGQFPVAEDASARLLALPFFAAIDERQIDRVCEALAEALRGDWT